MVIYGSRVDGTLGSITFLNCNSARNLYIDDKCSLNSVAETFKIVKFVDGNLKPLVTL